MCLLDRFVCLERGHALKQSLEKRERERMKE